MKQKFISPEYLLLKKDKRKVNEYVFNKMQYVVIEVSKQVYLHFREDGFYYFSPWYRIEDM
jgi:hypothetical protein